MRCRTGALKHYNRLPDSFRQQGCRTRGLMRKMVFGAGSFAKRSGRCLRLEDTARIRKKVATLKSGERQVSFRQTKASSPRLIPRLGGVRGRAELVSSCSPDKATLPRPYRL